MKHEHVWSKGASIWIDGEKWWEYDCAECLEKRYEKEN